MYNNRKSVKRAKTANSRAGPVKQIKKKKREKQKNEVAINLIFGTCR